MATGPAPQPDPRPDAALRTEAEQRLARSEARLRAIVETEPECVKLLAADGTLLEMNPAGLRMIEADSFQQVANRSVYPLIVEDQREKFREFNARIFRGESGTLEFQLNGLKGGRRWMETHAVPLRDETGRVVSHLAITRDISARKRDEALFQGQKRVLEMIAIGRPLAETADALLRVIETHSPEMICSLLLLGPRAERLHHCAGPRLPENFIEAVEGFRIGPTAGSCGTAAYRGEAVVVEDIANDPLWAPYKAAALPHGLRACWSTPLFDAQRKVLGTFAIYYREPGPPQAIHQRLIELATQTSVLAISRERAEAELRRSESRHRRLVESNIIGVMIADIDGGISEANDFFLRMVGYTRADLEAGLVRWDALTPAEWRPVDEHILREIKATGTCPPVEKEYFRKNGTRVPILAAVALLEGSSRACLCLIADISERKRAEQKIRAQLDEMRRWQEVTLGREDRVLELKREVNALHRRLAEPPKYAEREANS
ncbi:MAG: PAS domain S-box protein [Opitutaceae bacterium]|nr:PAS domain S-box protein [Opitutaceae bacterium]